jgi:hypothetical protein
MGVIHGLHSFMPIMLAQDFLDIFQEVMNAAQKSE